MVADVFGGLDIISPSAWPALPDDYFGRDLRAEAELVSTEFVHGATHSALHTVGGDSFLRGNSTYFHLCKLLFLFSCYQHINHRLISRRISSNHQKRREKLNVKAINLENEVDCICLWRCNARGYVICRHSDDKIPVLYLFRTAT